MPLPPPPFDEELPYRWKQWLHEVYLQIESFEGEWTPVLAGTTTSPTQSYLIQNGTYERHGDTVTVWCSLTLASSGITAGSGNAQITGLPYTVAGSSSCAIIGGNWGTSNTGCPTVGRIVTDGTSILSLYTYDNDAGNIAGHSLTSAADTGNLTSVVFTMTYLTDDPKEVV